MKRRDFLKTSSVSAVSIPVLLNGLNISVYPGSRLLKLLNPDSDKVLVLIQLQGGNDGLNTIIPIDNYDNLANARGNIIIPESSMLKLNDITGLHPVMTGMKGLFDDEKLTVIHSVGYPNQNRSHFRSTDIWTSASGADDFVSTGWIGRYFDTQYPGYPDDYPNSEFPHPIALTMASILSETCQGMVSNYSLALTDPFGLSPLLEGQGGDTPDTPYGHELEFLRGAIAQTNAYSDIIENAANQGSNLVTYPDGSRLAQQLKNVALLISGGLQTKVYVCSLGGFDTHANQVEEGQTSIGMHAELLQEVSDAVAAFQNDLKLQNLERRVVGMTFSEFGRQIRSNYGNGTDHGTAAPMFVFGSCVHAGIIGDNPEIAEDVDVQEGVAMQYDFRNVYGSLLVDWFEAEEADVKSLLFEDFQYIPVVQPCSSTTGTKDAGIIKELTTDAFPNPFKDVVNIRFTSENEHARLSIFDVRGQEIEVLVNRKLAAGEHTIQFDGRGLSPSNYYYRLQLSSRQKTKMISKV